MRQPFFVVGYQVTTENMEDIAKWCEGRVIDDADRPFVRVPVIRPIHDRQTRGYVGTWVLLSKRRGEKTFKVYTQEWLDREFWSVPNDEIEPSDLIQSPSYQEGGHFFPLRDVTKTSKPEPPPFLSANNVSSL